MTIVGTASRVLSYRPGRFIRGSAFLLLNLTIRAAALAALLILLARQLGPAGYGAFVSVQALAGLIAPLAGLGAQTLLVREAARRPDALTGLFGDVWRVWAVTAPLLAIVAFVAIIVLLPNILPVHAVAAIVISEVLCATVVETISRAYQSQDRMGRMGAVMTWLVLARLLTFAAFSPLAGWTAANWAWGYLGASLIYTAALIIFALRELGWPGRTNMSLGTIIRRSVPFAFAASAQRAQTEVNKPLLARLDSIAAAGTYAAAHRTLDVLLLPLTALMETLWPRVCRDLNPGRVLLQLGCAPLTAAVAGGVALFAAAPLLPLALGKAFAAAVPAAQMLAVFPIFFVIRSLLTTLIIATGDSRHLILAYGLSALTSLAVNAALIPHLGLTGVVCATYAAEFTLIASQGVLLAAYRHAR